MWWVMRQVGGDCILVMSVSPGEADTILKEQMTGDDSSPVAKEVFRAFLSVTQVRIRPEDTGSCERES